MTNQEAFWFLLDGWTQIEIKGADRKSFFHNFCTNDINGLQSGQSCEAFVPDIKGRILGHVLVINLESSLRLIATPGSNETLVPHLKKYVLGVDVEIEDRTAENSLLFLTGNKLPELIEPALGIALPANDNTFVVLDESPQETLLTRVAWLAEPSILLSGTRESVGNYQAKLLNLMPASSLDVFQSLRIENGFPWGGVDIGPANLAQEAARTEQAISFRKGCYLGQEPIARLDAMGHTNKELRGLVIDGTVNSIDCVVEAGGKEIGRITSSAQRLGHEQTLALAILRVKFAEPGTSVTVKTDQGDLDAVVYWPSLSNR